MNMDSQIDLIDINRKKGFPRTYRFSQFTRWFTIILATAAIVYAVWYVFTGVDAESQTLKKILPFVIIFLAGSSLFRNLFSLNTLVFLENGLEFRYIMAKTVSIRWEQIKKISMYSGRARAVVLDYTVDDEKKKLMFTMVFPNMLEIINSIAEMSPDAEYDEFMKNIIISKP